MAPVFMDPEQAVEGGDFPRGNLLITSARYGIFKYMRNGQPVMNTSGKPSTAVAALLDMRNDEGMLFHQSYSIGDPNRYTISADGDTIEEGAFKVNCNFMMLVTHLINRGYPAKRVRENPSISENLVGLYANWEQESEKRGNSGQLILPMELHQFPWGEAVKGAPVAPDVESYEKDDAPSSPPPTAKSVATGKTKKATKAAAEPADPDIIDRLVEATQGMLDSEDDDGTSRSDLSGYIFKHYDEGKMDMMGAIMTSDLTEALEEVGINLDGEEFVRA